METDGRTDKGIGEVMIIQVYAAGVAECVTALVTPRPGRRKKK